MTQIEKLPVKTKTRPLGTKLAADVQPGDIVCGNLQILSVRHTAKLVHLTAWNLTFGREDNWTERKAVRVSLFEVAR
jgi:hypothetical protein